MSDLEHFLDLATTGRNQGCSSGEWAALQLAQAVTEHATRLDASATAGLIEFVRVAQQHPTRVRELFGGLSRMD
ncbi:MAG: hypothetical protein ACLFV3_09225 [Phycisphaeraceae bacterium]